jgi:hypothetical protein
VPQQIEICSTRIVGVDDDLGLHALIERVSMNVENVLKVSALVSFFAGAVLSIVESNGLYFFGGFVLAWFLAYFLAGKLRR